MRVTSNSVILISPSALRDIKYKPKIKSNAAIPMLKAILVEVMSGLYSLEKNGIVSNDNSNNKETTKRPFIPLFKRSIEIIFKLRQQ